MKIISWNVNGIRAASKKGFLDVFKKLNADIFSIQETKAQQEQLRNDLTNIKGYQSYWSSSEKKGYSGTALYTKIPMSVSYMNLKEFDNEGRVLIGETEKFTLINAYFPNSQDEGKRLKYKLSFCDAILSLCNRFTKKKTPLILCGDYNIAHTAIDLARPKENEKSPGYLPEERKWMNSFLGKSKYIDTFRHFCPSPHKYTWWSYRANARTNNVGWRIDYFCVNTYAMKYISKSTILTNIMGSDHCPIQLSVTPPL